MRLIEASIRGFGKLVERSFPFARDAQIVVGDNETGKSTLQKFILAMLFGLKREDRKRREYLPEHELCCPWNGAAYAGRLVYELASGNRYEVLRDFDRKKESVQILDALSGRALTNEYPMDGRKERTFMQKQLQLTRRLFEATTSLGQLAGRPSAAGVDAFRERVQGLLDSGDEGVSARAALACLTEMRELCGSERTPTRGIGLLLKQRKILNSELEAARRRHAEILDLHARRKRVVEAHAQAEAAWRARRAADLARERKELTRRMQRAESLAGELETLRGRAKAFDDVAEVDVSDYAPARERAAAIAALDSEVRERDAALERAKKHVAELRGVAAALDSALANLDQDRASAMYRSAERLREQIGHVREARARHASEQRRNRGVVEALQQHHGRDWTHDDFMAQLASQRALVEEAEGEPIQSALQQVVRSYRVLKRRFQAAALLGTSVVAASAVLAAWNPLLWPVAARLALPVAVAIAALILLGASVRRVIARRDQVRALQGRATHFTSRRHEAEQWLQAQLEQNELGSIDEIYAARREYESLRAAAERSAAESSGRDLRTTETELAEHAALLHAQVQTCDFDALHAIQSDPPVRARALLPYAEASTLAQADGDDSAELQRLVADLARIPEVRRSLDWLARVREELVATEERAGLEESTLTQRRARLEGERAGLEAILYRNGARDVEELAQRVERQRQRHVILSEYRPLLHEQEGVLGGENIEALRARVAVLEGDESSQPARGGETVGFEDGERKASPEQLRHRVEELAAERAQLEERLSAREREGRTAAEVELELQENELRLAEERCQVESLSVAIETLEALAVARHREVAPRMNERVGEIFARLSRGRHTEVRLDEELTPRIRMDGEAVHGADSLSGGAADQLYFALRVTAGEQLARSGERLPLLLDDPFVQYDPDRLRAALDLVAELAVEHQILFFTCEASQAQALSDRLRARDLEHHTLLL
jgi:hypothetical protein